MHSPYRPGAGVMPAYLAGRTEEIRRVEALLARTEHYGTPAQAPFILTGHRGLGKTVTLHAIADRARLRGFARAHVTVDRHSSIPQRLAAALAEAVSTASGRATGRSQRQWTERLAAFSVKVSVAGVVTLGTKLDAHPREAPADRDALRDLLADAATRIRGHGKRGLMLTFDELQEGTGPGLVVLTNVLQDVLAGDAPLVVAGAGLPNTPDRLMDAGSFAERFTYRPLSVLTEAEATEALLNPAASVGVHWDREAAETVLHAAQGSPFLVQLYGNTTWVSVDPTPGGRLRGTDAAAGVASGRTELESGLFRGRWNRATAAEQRLLLAVAAVADSTGSATTADVNVYLDMSASQVSTQRAALIDKGLLYSPSRGLLAFTMPGFDTYLRTRLEG